MGPDLLWERLGLGHPPYEAFRVFGPCPVERALTLGDRGIDRERARAARRVASDALRTIERDTAVAVGRMRALLLAERFREEGNHGKNHRKIFKLL